MTPPKKSPPQSNPEGFQHSGASISREHTAASRVPTVFGSLGHGFWKQVADSESDDIRNRIQETGANLLFQLFSGLSHKGREMEIKTLCIR